MLWIIACLLAGLMLLLWYMVRDRVGHPISTNLPPEMKLKFERSMTMCGGVGRMPRICVYVTPRLDDLPANVAKVEVEYWSTHFNNKPQREYIDQMYQRYYNLYEGEKFVYHMRRIDYDGNAQEWCDKHTIIGEALDVKH